MDVTTCSRKDAFLVPNIAACSHVRTADDVDENGMGSSGVGQYCTTCECIDGLLCVAMTGNM